MTYREKIESKLGPDEYVFDPAMTTAWIKEQEALGRFPACHRCGTRLEYALSPEQALEKGVSPGVRCPARLSHFQLIIEFPRGT
jgi:hypothetical protein